jgi:hypothetical protein
VLRRDGAQEFLAVAFELPANTPIFAPFAGSVSNASDRTGATKQISIDTNPCAVRSDAAGRASGVDLHVTLQGRFVGFDGPQSFRPPVPAGQQIATLAGLDPVVPGYRWNLLVIAYAIPAVRGDLAEQEHVMKEMFPAWFLRPATDLGDFAKPPSLYGGVAYDSGACG